MCNAALYAWIRGFIHPFVRASNGTVAGGSVRSGAKNYITCQSDQFLPPMDIPSGITDLRLDSLKIPVTVCVGVTGQRSVGDEPVIRESLRKVLSRLDQILSTTPHRYIAQTSLLEGGDRLLAEEVLQWPSQGMEAGPELHLFLPCTPETYLEECATLESRERCELILDQASKIEVSAVRGPREAACEDVGRTIVHSCDVLVAIWDGESSTGKGGTGEMVRYARVVGRSIFWIHLYSGKIVEERHGDGILESLEYLDAFNREEIDVQILKNGCIERFERFSLKARMWGLDSSVLNPLGETLLPPFVLAHLLKRRYERLYMWGGAAVYGLAAAAVATVTIQTLFFPEYPELVWLEVAEIAAILVLLMISRIGDWHRKWIDYRFLSERLRTALFLSVFCVPVERPALPPHLSLSHTPNDWLNTAFEEILEKRPLEYCTFDIPFEPLKNFLISAWIDEQISFYAKNSTWNRDRFRLLSEAGDGLFTLTLIMAAIHAMGLEEILAPGPIDATAFLAAVTIVLPAVAGTLGAIRIKREYLRNSERYAHMVRHLSVIGNQIKRAGNHSELIRTLREANEVTLREQQDWRVVFRFREIETP